MKPKITFIVPVYNGAAWVDRCLASLRQQTFLNFEVIVVDDGSTDESAVRAMRFAQCDSRFAVWTIPHAGVSRARNFGIEKAAGECIGFLDADDWIEKEFAQRLLETLALYKADMVSCRSIPSQDVTKPEYREGDLHEIGKLYRPPEYLALEYRDPEVNVCVGNKLYARHLFSEVRFPEGEIYEDVVTNYMLCRQCRSIVHLPMPMHHYFTGNHSITRSPLRNKDMLLPKQWARIRQMAQDEFPELIPLVDAMRITSLRMLAGKYVKYGGSDALAKELIRAFRQSLPTVFRSAEIPPDKKLRSFAAMLSLPLYGWLTDLITGKDS